jgi:hypothetical protein
MLKGRDEILTAVRRRFKTSVVQVVVTETWVTANAGSSSNAGSSTGTSKPWPYSVALGRPTADMLANHMDQVSAYVADLRAWQDERGFEVRWSQRNAGGRQEVPTHVTVHDIDEAARMLGGTFKRQLSVMRRRAQDLWASFLELSADDAVRVLRSTRSWDETDYSLLLVAGGWFRAHDAYGLTPRQVPLAGFHAKWLNARGRREFVRLLSGKDELGLVDPPPSVAFAYLDPAYLSAGGRRFDLHVLGDEWELPYAPEVALIVENKDTYRYFPPFPRAVCIFGSGYAGSANVCRLPWLADVPLVAYWGDMDADGLAILNAYRSEGLNAESILMDLPSYRRYERYGTSQASGKQSLGSREEREAAHLTDAEAQLYALLCDPTHKGHRRVEQERIPLDDARQALARLWDARG